MKIPFQAPCTECKTEVRAFMDLDSHALEFQCPHGHQSSYSLDLTFTVGHLILRRAEYEFTYHQDWSMSMVLSATAFECELSRLHHKWEEIGAFASKVWLDDAKLDEMLRRYSNIRERIETVCRLMHPQGIDAFVSNAPDLREAIERGFPSLSLGTLARGFQQTLLWPRNRILHLGQTRYQREDAVGAFNLAQIGVAILDRMDQAKKASFNP